MNPLQFLLILSFVVSLVFCWEHNYFEEKLDFLEQKVDFLDQKGNRFVLNGFNKIKTKVRKDGKSSLRSLYSDLYDYTKEALKEEEKLVNKLSVLENEYDKFVKKLKGEEGIEYGSLYVSVETFTDFEATVCIHRKEFIIKWIRDVTSVMASRDYYPEDREVLLEIEKSVEKDLEALGSIRELLKDGIKSAGNFYNEGSQSIIIQNESNLVQNIKRLIESKDFVSGTKTALNLIKGLVDKYPIKFMGMSFGHKEVVPEVPTQA